MSPKSKSININNNNSIGTVNSNNSNNTTNTGSLISSPSTSPSSAVGKRNMGLCDHCQKRFPVSSIKEHMETCYVKLESHEDPATQYYRATSKTPSPSSTSPKLTSSNKSTTGKSTSPAGKSTSPSQKTTELHSSPINKTPTIPTRSSTRFNTSPINLESALMSATTQVSSPKVTPTKVTTPRSPKEVKPSSPKVTTPVSPKSVTASSPKVSTAATPSPKSKKLQSPEKKLKIAHGNVNDASSPSKQHHEEEEEEDTNDSEVNGTKTATTTTSTSKSKPKKKERVGRMMSTPILQGRVIKSYLKKDKMEVDSSSSNTTTPPPPSTPNNNNHNQIHTPTKESSTTTTTTTTSNHQNEPLTPNSSLASTPSTSPRIGKIHARKSKYVPKKVKQKAVVEDIKGKEWSDSTVRDWKIPEAPVFYPTVEEFKFPLKYIEKIRPIGEKYGICKIVPPVEPTQDIKSFIDPKKFKFKTKIQNIHQLKSRWSGPSEVFVSILGTFLEARGTPFDTFPKYDGRDLDLYKLFIEVIRRGGLWEVTRSNSWHDVLNALRITGSCSKPVQSLKQLYTKYLYEFELDRKKQYQDDLVKSNGTRKVKSVVDQIVSECLAKDHHFNNNNSNQSYDDSENESNQDEMEVESGKMKTPTKIVKEQPIQHQHQESGDEESKDEKEEHSESKEEDDEDDEQFGFYEGETYSLEDFERIATNFTRRWFPLGNNTPEAVENHFWRIVENGDENVQVHYGSDLDVRTHGSGFDRSKKVIEKEKGGECRDGYHWNLNTLPKMEGSVFSHLNDSIAGVTDPMMYVGMLFSSFCWHNEDNYLYSINYMHKGTYKTWYGAPGGDGEKFEAVMRQSVPKLFEKTPNLLYLLITMVSPDVFKRNNVPIYTTIQGPGEFVITFPQAYHAGFSHGFTIAEAVNFAPADWIPFACKSVERYKEVKRSSVFSIDQLLLRISKNDPAPTVEIAKWILPELIKTRDTEEKLRKEIEARGFKSEKVKQQLDVSEEDEDIKQCFICKCDCYLSYLECRDKKCKNSTDQSGYNVNNNNSNGWIEPTDSDDEEEEQENLTYCLLHSCSCNKRSVSLKINKSIQEIDEIIGILKSITNPKKTKQQKQQSKNQSEPETNNNNNNNTNNQEPIYKFPTPSSLQTLPTPAITTMFGYTFKRK